MNIYDELDEDVLMLVERFGFVPVLDAVAFAALVKSRHARDLDTRRAYSNVAATLTNLTGRPR